MTAFDDQRARLITYLTQAGLSARRAQANLDTLLTAAEATRPDGQHQYLSTGCLHGRHDYCQNKNGIAGPKAPGRCKWCPAVCACPCHTEEIS